MIEELHLGSVKVCTAEVLAVNQREKSRWCEEQNFNSQAHFFICKLVIMLSSQNCEDQTRYSMWKCITKCVAHFNIPKDTKSTLN